MPPEADTQLVPVPVRVELPADPLLGTEPQEVVARLRKRWQTETGWVYLIGLPSYRNLEIAPAAPGGAWGAAGPHFGGVGRRGDEEHRSRLRCPWAASMSLEDPLRRDHHSAR